MIACMFDTAVLSSVDPFADEAALIERIAELDRVKSAAAAGQAKAAAALDANRRVAESDAGVPAAQRGRGMGSEIALARRDSPARGGRHLGLGKALVDELPHTLQIATGCAAVLQSTAQVRHAGQSSESAAFPLRLA
jgi:hypothetical protein